MVRRARLRQPLPDVLAVHLFQRMTRLAVQWGQTSIVLRITGQMAGWKQVEWAWTLGVVVRKARPGLCYS